MLQWVEEITLLPLLEWRGSGAAYKYQHQIFHIVCWIVFNNYLVSSIICQRKNWKKPSPSCSLSMNGEGAVLLTIINSKSSNWAFIQNSTKGQSCPIIVEEKNGRYNVRTYYEALPLSHLWRGERGEVAFVKIFTILCISHSSFLFKADNQISLAGINIQLWPHHLNQKKTGRL